MISEDNLNLLLTIVSIIVTLISIVFSIWSFLSARKAEQYKEETLQLRDTFDLERLLGTFQSKSRTFQEMTREKSWYKGIDPNHIISPFKEVLSSFGRIYYLISEKDRETLKKKVHDLDQIVFDYDKAKYTDKKKVNVLIREITDILHNEIHSNTVKVVKSR
jgi:hypothetical protein